MTTDTSLVMGNRYVKQNRRRKIQQGDKIFIYGKRKKRLKPTAKLFQIEVNNQHNSIKSKIYVKHDKQIGYLRECDLEYLPKMHKNIFFPFYNERNIRN